MCIRPLHAYICTETASGVVCFRNKRKNSSSRTKQWNATENVIFIIHSPTHTHAHTMLRSHFLSLADHRQMDCQ